MTAERKCAECAKGELVYGPAIVKVRHTNPNRPNLTITKWVCEEHWSMLGDDYGDELKVIEKLADSGEEYAAARAAIARAEGRG